MFQKIYKCYEKYILNFIMLLEIYKFYKKSINVMRNIQKYINFMRKIGFNTFIPNPPLKGFFSLRKMDSFHHSTSNFLMKTPDPPSHSDFS